MPEPAVGNAFVFATLRVVASLLRYCRIALEDIADGDWSCKELWYGNSIDMHKRWSWNWGWLQSAEMLRSQHDVVVALSLPATTLKKEQS
jgi:hypothetical protein